MKYVIIFVCACLSSLAIAQESATQTQPAQSPATTASEADKTQANRATTASTAAKPAQPKGATRADRLDLDTTIVTGNRELPKVLYIVPWKKAEIGDLPAQPFNSLLDEVLAPVDRDVFKREVKYFHTVTQGDAAPNAGAVKDSTGGSH